jgi:hypothetical protein
MEQIPSWEDGLEILRCYGTQSFIKVIQEPPHTGPYPESDKSSLYPYTLFP